MSQDLWSYLDEKKKNVGQEAPLPLLVAIDIMLWVAEDMSYLHETGVMHCDLQVNNVLINVVEDLDGHLSSSSLQVKFTDFGLSKLKLHDSNTPHQWWVQPGGGHLRYLRTMKTERSTKNQQVCKLLQ